MKSVIVLIVFMLTASIVGVNAIHAQSDEACDTEELAQMLEEQAAAVMEGNLEGLQALQALISQTQAECAGLAFEGDDNEVIGPLEFEDGVYRIEFETDTFGSVTFTEIDGNCGFVLLSVFDMDGGTDNTATELDGCEMLIEVSSTDDWTLIFEKVD